MMRMKMTVRQGTEILFVIEFDVDKAGDVEKYTTLGIAEFKKYNPNVGLYDEISFHWDKV